MDAGQEAGEVTSMKLGKGGAKGAGGERQKNGVGGEMRNGTGCGGRGETGVVLFRENWRTRVGKSKQHTDVGQRV